jgi:hypothetical protein
MEDITQTLQQLMKSGKVPKLIYKQSTQKKASIFLMINRLNRLLRNNTGNRRLNFDKRK